MQLAFFQRLAQWLALPEHLVLADDFIEASRPHAIRERAQAIVERTVAQQVRLRRRAGLPAWRHRASLRWPSSQPANSGQRASPSRAATRPSSAPMEFAATSRMSPSRPTSM